MAEQWLAPLLRERDVAADEAARNEMFEKSHQMGVPVIDIDGKIIVGFEKKTIEEALGKE